MTDISVHPNDLWTMLLCTVRYSMGRMTYMPSTCVGLYQRYGKALCSRERGQLLKEIQAELDRAHNRGALLGHATDDESWTLLTAQIAADLSGPDEDPTVDLPPT